MKNKDYKILEKLLGVKTVDITPKEKHICCDGECNHDACCGKIPENCPLKNTNCCNAEIKTDCADEGTCCYVCTKCNKACDAITNQKDTTCCMKCTQPTNECKCTNNFMQTGDVVSCGHCDERFKEGLKDAIKNGWDEKECRCVCHKYKNNFFDGVEEKFDKEFVSLGEIIESKGFVGTKDFIKSFLKSTLIEYGEYLKKQIGKESRVLPKCVSINDIAIACNSFVSLGINQALSTAQDIISESINPLREQK